MEGILPPEVIWRRKAAFGAPIRSWLRDDLRDMVRDLLSGENLCRRGYFNPAAVQQMIQADESGMADHSLRIWALLTLEIWMRLFVDNTLIPPTFERLRNAIYSTST
jgi:asparagine synthase (glutamine-hydrolysing)